MTLPILAFAPSRSHVTPEPINLDLATKLHLPDLLLDSLDGEAGEPLFSIPQDLGPRSLG